MEDGPKVARPGFVSLIPGGGIQQFPTDPVADRERDRVIRVSGRRHIRRRPREAACVA
jgi:hypothetical protein